MDEDAIKATKNIEALVFAANSEMLRERDEPMLKIGLRGFKHHPESFEEKTLRATLESLQRQYKENEEEKQKLYELYKLKVAEWEESINLAAEKHFSLNPT